MTVDDQLREQIHASLDDVTEPIPNLAPVTIARIRASKPPRRGWVPALQAAGVLALAAIVGSIVFVSHQLTAAHQAPPPSATVASPPAVASPSAVDPTRCRLPVIANLEVGPPNPQNTTQAGFVDTATGQYVGDASASIAGLPGGGSPGSGSIKPATPPMIQSYSSSLQRWLPVYQRSVAPDGRSYVWDRLLPAGSTYGNFQKAELHWFDLAAGTDHVLWTYPGSINVERWDGSGIIINTVPPTGGVQLRWRADPVSGTISQLPPVNRSEGFTELPGDRGKSPGLGYAGIGTDTQGRSIFRIGSRQAGDRDWGFFETAPGQRVYIYKGTQGDATGFDPMETFADSTGLWFGDYNHPQIWHWSASTGLRKMAVTGQPSGTSTTNVYVNPVGPCM